MMPSPKRLGLLLTTCATLVISLPSISHSQDCKVIDRDIVSIDGVEYLYFSQDRMTKISTDLRMYELVAKENLILKDTNSALKNNVAVLESQLSFYQKQVDAMMNAPVRTSSEKDGYTLYPVLGAFILGNLTSSIAYGYWSSQAAKMR